MRTIVVGVDGSPPSLEALRFTSTLVDDLENAALIVVYARYVGYLWSPNHAAEDEFADLLDDTERLVQDCAERELNARPISWQIVVREGEPSQVLCDIARETGASFVVVGRRGWSTAHELMLGSVSNRLVHRGDCTVLLVH